VWVSDVDGHSAALRLRDTVVSGFLGRVRYVCDGSDEEAAAVDALLAFARFAGIGSHTAFGLGSVEVNPTWQPGRASPTGAAAGRPR
jgi:CRISPR/Cas system endoribonuclease Cas6 (RAMP superfamily)